MSTEQKSETELRTQILTLWRSLDEKWLPMYQGHKVGHGVSDCACCITYRNDSRTYPRQCEGCPVFEDMERPDCIGTPYVEARDAQVSVDYIWRTSDSSILRKLQDGPEPIYAANLLASVRYREAVRAEYAYLADLALRLTAKLWEMGAGKDAAQQRLEYMAHVHHQAAMGSLIQNRLRGAPLWNGPKPAAKHRFNWAVMEYKVHGEVFSTMSDDYMVQMCDAFDKLTAELNAKEDFDG